jgi:hypothetical protein
VVRLVHLHIFHGITLARRAVRLAVMSPAVPRVCEKADGPTPQKLAPLVRGRGAGPPTLPHTHHS